MGLFIRARGFVALALLTSVVAGVAGGLAAAVPAGAAGLGSFQPLSPARVLDTRTGNGAPAMKIGPGQTLVLQVGGRGGVPDSGVAAVSVNITVTQPSASSWLTAWPTGTDRPTASILNFPAGTTIANSTVVGVSYWGEMSIYNSSGSTHVLVDVSGWFPSGGDFTALTPERVLDTRTGNGAPVAKVGPGQTLTLQVGGHGGVPASGVAAVSVNITVTQPSANSWLTVWPAGSARPTASILNFPAGRTIANSTIVGLSSDGRMSIYNASGSTHVLVDVSGWFPSGGDFTALVPSRLLDTRTGEGAPVAKIGPRQTLTLQVGGRGGVPASGVGAVSVNVTVTQPSTGSWLTAWPTGEPRPATSILNFSAGQTIANSMVVGVSASGQISIYNSSGSSHVLVDVAGWFSPPFQPLSNVADVSLGVAHSCALLTDGTVKCWGSNRDDIWWNNDGGQLGDGTGTNRSTAVPVVGLTGVSQISVGGTHSCALLTDGTVKCWGVNTSGQLGDGTTTNRLTPVTVTGLSGVAYLSAGYYHTCAVLTGGTVKCWGANNYGQLGDGTTIDRMSPVAVGGLAGVSQVSLDYTQTCAVLSGGSAKCWGGNAQGELGDGSTTDRLSPVSVSGLSGVVEIDAGADHSCARLTNSTVKCWGTNFQGELGDGTTTLRLTPVSVVGLSGAADLSVAGWHACAALTDGSARCWGRNDSGQVGDGTMTTRFSPVAVSGLSGATRVAAGAFHSCALLSSGTISCWGHDSEGQLGDAGTSDKSIPVTVLE